MLFQHALAPHIKVGLVKMCVCDFNLKPYGTILRGLVQE
jgi:hypothetical protein